MEGEAGFTKFAHRKHVFRGITGIFPELAAFPLAGNPH